MRCPLVQLDDHDASLLKSYLSAYLEPLEHHLDVYRQIAKGRQVQQQSAATAPHGDGSM